MMLFLTSCMAHDKQYYRNNPQKLQAALKNCPEQQPKNVNCDVLKDIAQEMNRYAYELQLSPQQFGQKILLLQVQLAKMQDDVNQNSNQPDLKDKIAQNQQELETRLAVVKWLESPESRS